MPISAPTLKYPAITYLDATSTERTLYFQLPPISVGPMAPVPVRADNVAGDGTMWTVYQYTECYLTMTAQMLLGADLSAWMTFLYAAVNGQVTSFFPDQGNVSNYALVRLMAGSSSGSSNAPSGNPSPKRVAFGRFTVDLVFRFETPSDALWVHQALNGL